MPSTTVLCLVRRNSGCAMKCCCSQRQETACVDKYAHHRPFNCIKLSLAPATCVPASFTSSEFIKSQCTRLTMAQTGNGIYILVNCSFKTHILNTLLMCMWMRLFLDVQLEYNKILIVCFSILYSHTDTFDNAFDQDLLTRCALMLTRFVLKEVVTILNR